VIVGRKIERRKIAGRSLKVENLKVENSEPTTLFLCRHS